MIIQCQEHVCGCPASKPWGRKLEVWGRGGGETLPYFTWAKLVKACAEVAGTAGAVHKVGLGGHEMIHRGGSYSRSYGSSILKIRLAWLQGLGAFHNSDEFPRRYLALWDLSMSLLPLAIRWGSGIDFTLYQKWGIIHSLFVYPRAWILPPLTSKMGLKIGTLNIGL